MKKCANCGFLSQDEAISCPSCTTDAFVTSSPQALGHIISPAEASFWERMTFRHFAIFFIRVQSIWLFFYGIIDATYLVEYWAPNYPHFIFALRAKMIVVRIAMYFGAGIYCLRYADRIVSWFVKDIIPKLPPNMAATTNTVSGDSTKF